MIPYEKMYAIVCGAASDALELLPPTAETARARATLEQALAQAEEVYLISDEAADVRPDKPTGQPA